MEYEFSLHNHVLYFVMMWCPKHHSCEYGTEISLNSLQIKLHITQNYYLPLCKAHLCIFVVGCNHKETYHGKCDNSFVLNVLGLKF
jgi:hypothetical protein